MMRLDDAAARLDVGSPPSIVPSPPPADAFRATANATVKCITFFFN